MENKRREVQHHNVKNREKDQIEALSTTLRKKRENRKGGGRFPAVGRGGREGTMQNLWRLTGRTFRNPPKKSKAEKKSIGKSRGGGKSNFVNVWVGQKKLHKGVG